MGRVSVKLESGREVAQLDGVELGEERDFVGSFVEDSGREWYRIVGCLWLPGLLELTVETLECICGDDAGRWACGHKMHNPECVYAQINRTEVPFQQVDVHAVLSRLEEIETTMMAGMRAAIEQLRQLCPLGTSAGAFLAGVYSRVVELEAERDILFRKLEV